jgi:hypothetical protein
MRAQSEKMRDEAARSNVWFTKGGNVAALEIVPIGG